MNWFLIALCAPILWSLTNHIDKYILSKYSTKDTGVGGIILYSALFPILILPIILIFESHIFNIGAIDTFLLLIAGIVSFFAIFFYLQAISRDETSAVIPFFQLIPVFGYGLAYLILGETLNLNQIIGCLIIITGALILSIEFNIESKTKIKKTILVFMIGSSLMYAFYDVLFKFVAIKENFLVSVFWEQTGTILAGIFVLVFIKNYRNSFFNLLRNRSKKLFSLNVINELIYAGGVLFYNYALVLAPVVLVMLVVSYQPAIVFIEGVLLTFFLPKIANEKMTLKHSLQKIAAIVIIFVGGVVLFK